MISKLLLLITFLSATSALVLHKSILRYPSTTRLMVIHDTVMNDDLEKLTRKFYEKEILKLQESGILPRNTEIFSRDDSLKSATESSADASRKEVMDKAMSDAMSAARIAAEKEVAERKAKEEAEEAARISAEEVTVEQKANAAQTAKESTQSTVPLEPPVTAATEVSSKQVSITPTPTTPTTVSTAMSNKESKAFDVGLLIAFPIMIGTLALFFVFPLMKDQIAANLPPPGTY